MHHKQILAIIGLIIFTACSSSNNISQNTETEKLSEEKSTNQLVPHQYGGWYCPDNLNGFPAVDIANWKNVPVIQGKMPTLEEAQSGASLIYVDPEKYPDAKALPVSLPRLAKFYNNAVNREDIVIIIQAFTVQEDTIVGFRYLNGGNGSARLNEVNIMSDSEISKLSPSKFVSLNIMIQASRESIWNVLTDKKYLNEMEEIFNAGSKLNADWRQHTNMNYHYHNAGKSTAIWGNEVFGFLYIQNDYEQNNFTEKILLLDNKENQTTDMKLVFGPYENDFDEQKIVLEKWATKVKELSENI